MKKTILFNFDVDKDKNTIHVERSFEAPIDLVWAAWTEPEILDQWWAPKPYQNVTKSLDLEVGGRWHYYMVGLEGDIHWCLFEYDSIEKEKHFSGTDAFCDESANINTNQPRVKWKNDFSVEAESTLVNMLLHFESLEDLETIIQMGFKEGFSAGLENLDRFFEETKKA